MDVGLNNKNTLGEIDPSFKDVVFLVEATSNEQFTLWVEWSKESMSNIEPLSDDLMNDLVNSIMIHHYDELKKVIDLNNKVKKFKRTRVDWKQVNSGFMLTIGHIKKMPVCVEFSFAFINGKKICFYNCSSRVADHTMIKDWLIERFQLTNDGYTRWNHTDSSNFHNCVNSLDNIDVKPRRTVYKKSK